MKILTAQQLYEADKFTIKAQNITSEALMERAAISLFNWLHERLQGAPVKIHLFCGIGNNGGDGVALARHLWEHGYDIQVYVVNYSEKRSPDFLTNLERLKERKVWPEFLNDKSPLPEIPESDFVVDAIFGIGLNRPPDTWVAGLIEHINNSKAFILAVDLPSGLFVDQPVKHKTGIIKAQFVLSIQAPKLIFYLPDTASYVTDWDVIDIGMDREFLNTMEVKFREYGKLDLLPFYKPRSRFAHKGHFGHALIIGGSHGKIGAVNLAAAACLQSGAGLVTAYVPGCGYSPLQTALPEVMVLTDPSEDQISAIDFELEPQAIGIGIGMGTSAKTLKAFSDFMKSNKALKVVDADGINALSKMPELHKNLKDAVLSPHPGELERLIGKWDNDFEKLEKAFAFVAKNNCVLIIKGAYTTILHNDRGYVNRTGNPGMATAGSGDVLTGILTGLLAQGYSPLETALMGVYLHGLAGDILAGKVGFEAVTASGISNAIGDAFIEFLKIPEVQPPKEDIKAEE